MKSQKGITLISLTIYIIVMVIVVTVVALISNYMFKNMNSVSEAIDPLTEYIRFNSFFTDEVNTSGIKILDCQDDYILFDNNVQYTFVEANEAIYLNKAKIAKNVTNCKFSVAENDGKKQINVQITLDDNETKNTTYTLKD